jgi:NADH dehydrogenase
VSLPQRVVFVGGGYATLHPYRVLARRRRRELRRGLLEIVVLSADDHHSFHGFTGEVLAGTLPLEVTRASLRDPMPRAAVIPAVVTGGGRERRVVTYLRVEGPAPARRSRCTTTIWSWRRAAASRSRTYRAWPSTGSRCATRATCDGCWPG